MTPLYHHHVSVHCPGFMDIQDRSLRLSDNDRMIYHRFFGYQTIACIPHKSMVDNLEQLIQQTQGESALQLTDIDLCIHVHTHQQVSPHHQPHLPALHDRLPGLRCPCFGVSIHNCVSFFTAMTMTQAYFTQQKDACHALIVAGDLIHTPFQRIIPRTAIMGECMTASWLSTQPSPHRLMAISLRTHGQYAHQMHHQSGDASFEHNYQQHLQNIIEDCIQQAGIHLDDLAMILPHNVSIYSWHRFAKHMGMDQQRFFLDNIAKYGHCFNADASLNWASVDFSTRMPHGGYYLMIGVGLGATFAAAIWHYTPNA